MKPTLLIKTLKVTSKGQIALPKDVRRLTNIKEGDRLILIQKDRRIMLEKANVIKKRVEDDFRDLLKLTEESLKEIWDNKEDEIWNTYLKKK